MTLTRNGSLKALCTNFYFTQINKYLRKRNKGLVEEENIFKNQADNAYLAGKFSSKQI